MRTTIALSLALFLTTPVVAWAEDQAIAIGPWTITTSSRGDKFDSCTMSRSSNHLDVSFIRDQDGLILLWPEAYPIDALHRIRQNTPARFFSALYQQQPAREEGDYFKAEWLRPYDKAPPRETLKIYGASDTRAPSVWA